MVAANSVVLRRMLRMSQGKREINNIIFVKPFQKNTQKSQIRYNKVFFNCSHKCELGDRDQVARASGGEVMAQTDLDGQVQADLLKRRNQVSKGI